MLELGFPSLFMIWVRECIKIVSYSILIHGVLSKPFCVIKGLR